MAQRGSVLMKDIFLGGISDSKYTGIANSVAACIGLNLHGEPGLIKVNQKLTKESGATVDDAVSVILPCSDGKEYLFGRSNGKIWSRNAGSYTLEATNANGATLNAFEYNGYVYYCSATKVGRWQIGTAWSGRDDNHFTFTNGNTSYHPMIVKNLVLYIGDGYLVAQIDDSTGTALFTGNALDLEKKYVITALGEIQDDLLVGAFTSTNVVETKIFRWNTYAESFISDDAIPETKINAFIPADNFVLVSAGQKGNLYTYTGSQLDQFKRIQGDWSGTKKAFVNSEAVVNFNGLPLFGLSNNSGDAAPQGVYSFGSFSSNYPKVLNLEYVISTGHTTGVEITAMALSGDTLLVAWKDMNGGTTYGVDKVDTTAKYNGAYFDTRVLTFDRMNGKDFTVRIAYRTLNGGSITLKKSVNGGNFDDVTLTNDTVKALYYTKEDLTSAGSLQLRVTFVPAGGDANATPEVEAVEIAF